MGIISETLVISPEIHIFVGFDFAKVLFTFKKKIFHYEEGEILLWAERFLYSLISPGGKASI